MAEDSKNDIPAINRSIGTVMKAMEKLKKLGVLCNFSYCLPLSGTIYSHGWETVETMVLNNFDSMDDDTYNAIVQKNLKDIKKDKTILSREPKVFFGSLPFALDASRDQLRPLLVEMVRVAQSKGMYCVLYIIYFVCPLIAPVLCLKCFILKQKAPSLRGVSP